MRSASTRRWARCTCDASASCALPASPRASNKVDERLAHDYLDALKHQRRLAGATLANYARALDVLLQLHKKPIATLEAAEVRRAVAILHGKGLSPRTLALVLSAWRGWFNWLVRHRGFKANPVLGVRAPKAGRPLPKALSVEATQQLLDNNTQGVAAARDRAMFELLYSSGLRRAELIALDAADGRLDLKQAEVKVTGKGSKTRDVPVGAKAREAVRAWIASRAQLAAPGERGRFRGGGGRRIAPTVVNSRLGAWARRCGLGQHVHPHMLRHSFAT